MARVLFVTHPEVIVDPAVPVPAWRLAPRGCARMATFAASPAAANVNAVYASGERKAAEAAAILAGRRGLPVTVVAELHENDRAATGYLAAPEFEATADRFFAEPLISVRGWERAIDAQARIAISSLVPDYYGGNMDLPDMAPGAIAYFPVQTAGAYLYVGDCHARQGDGELCGVATEMHATVTLTVDLIKGWSIAWPRLETERLIIAIGSARPMEDAIRIAYRELIRWLEADWGWDPLEAYLFLTQAGLVRLGNMVDPKYTLGAAVEKSYLG